jgi:hypothetical protein
MLGIGWTVGVLVIGIVLGYCIAVYVGRSMDDK